MVDLLSPSERNQIKAAFRDIMDTYSRTPVILRVAGISMARFNEDRTDKEYTEYPFNAIALYGKDALAEDSNLSGKTDKATVEVIVHIDVLAALGLIVDDVPTINVAVDLIVVNGEEYNITYVSTQGQVDKRQTKIHIKGRIREKYYNSENI